MIVKVSVLISALVVLVACILATCWYLDIGHDSAEKLPQFHGKTIEQVVAELGVADRTNEFTIEEVEGEFRIELLNHYSPDSPEGRSTPIKELTWFHSRYSLTIWFHKEQGDWRALDSCRWKKNVSF